MSAPQSSILSHENSMPLCLDPHKIRRSKSLCKVQASCHYPFQPISIFIFWWNKLFFLQKWQNWKTHTQNKLVSLVLVGVCFFSDEIKFISCVNSKKVCAPYSDETFKETFVAGFCFTKKCVFRCKNSMSWRTLFYRNGRIGKHESTHTQNKHVSLVLMGVCFSWER